MAGTYKNLPNVALGDLHTFNMAHGFSEAIIRGMRKGFLSEQEYSHISQCDNLAVRESPLLFLSTTTFINININIKTHRILSLTCKRATTAPS